jgi:hypothetical protein
MGRENMPKQLAKACAPRDHSSAGSLGSLSTPQLGITPACKKELEEGRAIMLEHNPVHVIWFGGIVGIFLTDKTCWRQSSISSGIDGHVASLLDNLVQYDLLLVGGFTKIFYGNY